MTSGTDDITLTPATLDRVALVADLINQSYRGHGGWTRETALVDGERIQPEAVAALIGKEGSHLLVAERDGEAVACIHLSEDGGPRDSGDRPVHIGLFSVYPDLQGLGLGKHILALAEDYAVARLRANRLTMSVLTRRPELIAFYERRGYRVTGGHDPYPIHENVGVPRVSGLKLGRMEKRV